MSEQKHTPTPWRVDEHFSTEDEVFIVAKDGVKIAEVNPRHLNYSARETAVFIVRAVNAYDSLVAAAGYIPEQVDLTSPRFKDADDSDTVAIEVTVGWLREVRDALTLVSPTGGESRSK